MSGYRTQSCKIKQSSDIREEWLDLQSRSAPSFFQSWSWIGVWLDQIAIELNPVVVKVWFDEQLVGMGVFVSRDVKRRVVFRSRVMYLNECPFDDKDMTIENNGLLLVKGHENAVYSHVIEHLLEQYRRYDEFIFGAVSEHSGLFLTGAVGADNADIIINEQSDSWSVDLSLIASGVDGYLASLSKNRRGRIRRSIRLYEKTGTLCIEEAENAAQALLYFDRLKALHTEYWQAKGESGSFSNPRWERFHRTLIQNHFDAGEIQLLKVSNEAGEVGIIYNVILHKHVYIIQTGFRREQDKRLMPGYVAHTLAIALNKSRGMTDYDLLHGDALYKRILCDRKQTLLWVVVQRRRLRFRVEKIVVNAVRRLRKLF